MLEYERGRHKIEVTGEITRIEYDPNRTAYIGECTSYGRKAYKIIGGPEGEVEVREGREIKVIRVKDVRVGEKVYKVSQRGGEQGKIARAAGAGCKVIKQGEGKTVIRLPSGEVKEIGGENTCYEGVV